MEKTWGFVMSSLFWLGMDILWYNLYGIAVAVALGVMIWRTIRAERSRDRRQRDGGQSQMQQSNTNVSIHTNSQRPISIVNGKLQDEQNTPRTSTAKSQSHQGEMETESRRLQPFNHEIGDLLFINDNGFNLLISCCSWENKIVIYKNKGEKKEEKLKHNKVERLIPMSNGRFASGGGIVTECLHI